MQLAEVFLTVRGLPQSVAYLLDKAQRREVSELASDLKEKTQDPGNMCEDACMVRAIALNWGIRLQDIAPDQKEARQMLAEDIGE